MEINIAAGTGEIANQSSQLSSEKRPEMTELIKSHLDEVAGGLADHSSWFSTKTGL